MAVFDDQEAVAFLSKKDMVAYLSEMGDQESVDALKRSRASAQSGSFWRKPYTNSAHALGFIPEAEEHLAFRPIVPAVSIDADKELIGQRIKLNLDSFYVEQYPGLGKHTVTIEFSGRDQNDNGVQALRFATALDIADKDSGGFSGMPVFSGLMVPEDGVAFETRTICVKSSGSEAILGVLKGPLFKSGLSILAQAQPALPQLVSLASGVTQSLLDQKNKIVQAFELGLDFSKTPTSARLRLGSYVVMQVPDLQTFSWDNWVFSADAMGIVSAQNSKERAPFNTLIYSLSRSGSQEALSAKPVAGKGKKK